MAGAPYHCFAPELEQALVFGHSAGNLSDTASRPCQHGSPLHETTANTPRIPVVQPLAAMFARLQRHQFRVGCQLDDRRRLLALGNQTTHSSRMHAQ